MTTTFLKTYGWALAIAFAIGCGGSTTDLGEPASGAPSAADPVAPSQTPGSTGAAGQSLAIETVISGLELPTAFAVTSAHVYFGRRYSSDLMRFDRADGRRVELGLPMLGSTPTSGSPSFAADEAGFFVQSLDGSQRPVIVGSPVPGCSLQECDGFVPRWKADSFGSVGEPVMEVSALALDATHVYWLVREAFLDHSVTLVRAERDAFSSQPGPPRPVETIWRSSSSAFDLVLDGGVAYVGGGGELFAIDVSTKRVEYSNRNGGPKTGIGVDGRHVYWMHDGSVHRRETRAGANVEDWHPIEGEVWHPAGGRNPYALLAAVSERHVYVFDVKRNEMGSLLRVDKETRETVTVTEDLAGAEHGLLHGGYFYWSNTRAGTIQRVVDR